MLPFSKELRKELEDLSEKYKIKRGIFCFEQDIEGSTPRVMIFDTLKEKLDIVYFSKFLQRCIQGSETFFTIVSAMNTTVISEAIQEQNIMKIANDPKNKNKLN